jgi:hypothetical protein
MASDLGLFVRDAHDADHNRANELILLPLTSLPSWNRDEKVGPDSDEMDIVYRMILSLMTEDNDEGCLLHKFRNITEHHTCLHHCRFHVYGNLPRKIVESFVSIAGEERVAKIYNKAIETLHHVVFLVLEGRIVLVPEPVVVASSETRTNTDDSQMSCLSPFDNSHLLRHILLLVGKNQYRFVAAINKEFQNAYLQLFLNNKSTYYNTSTVEHTDLCIAESRHISSLRNATLCNSMQLGGSAWECADTIVLAFYGLSLGYRDV